MQGGSMATPSIQGRCIPTGCPIETMLSVLYTQATTQQVPRHLEPQLVFQLHALKPFSAGGAPRSTQRSAAGTRRSKPSYTLVVCLSSPTHSASEGSIPICLTVCLAKHSRGSLNPRLVSSSTMPCLL